MNSAPVVLSTFTGLGGLDLGLECAGFKTIACIENDCFARRSLRANRPNWFLRGPGDITKLAKTLRPAALGLAPRELAVLAGGPPCAPFSKAAQWSATGRSGWTDARAGECISAYIRLAEAFLPSVLLIENVPGFVKGSTSAIAHLAVALNRINEVHGTSYHVQSNIVNAVDYGVPQRRERAIVIAFREGGSFVWPTPTHRRGPVRAWDALFGVKSKIVPKLAGRWAELMPSIPEGWNYLWHTEHGRGRCLFGYRTRYWSFLLKLAKKQPSWTLSAQPGPATGPFHWENRPLSVEELLRIQSFPVDWDVLGPYREQVRQVGNATPPLLAEIIARAIGEQRFGLSYSASPKLRIPRRRVVPRARRRVPLKDEFKALEGNHAAHPGTGKGPDPVSRAA